MGCLSREFTGAGFCTTWAPTRSTSYGAGFCHLPLNTPNPRRCRKWRQKNHSSWGYTPNATFPQKIRPYWRILNHHHPFIAGLMFLALIFLGGWWHCGGTQDLPSTRNMQVVGNPYKIYKPRPNLGPLLKGLTLSKLDLEPQTQRGV